MKNPTVIQIAFGSPRRAVAATAAPPMATMATEADALQHIVSSLPRVSVS
ncbi:hypothetical protein [Dinoroseobacter shibae]